MEDILYIDCTIYEPNSDHLLQPIIDLLRNCDKKIVIYGTQSEYYTAWIKDYLNFGSEFVNYHLFDELENVLIEKNINFYLVVGCDYNEVFSNFETHPIKNFQIIYWPTYLISHVFSNLKKYYSSTRITPSFEHLFITYNNKTRFHRREMMDELCKRNLLKNNLYSWIESGHFNHGGERLGNYKFQCFKDEKVMLDNFNYEEQREFTSNIFDMKCLINIVTESDIDSIFITEKTYRQLMIGQPFLTLCGKDTHKKLQEYGFQLYDEIFDYSFDSLPNYKDRIKGIINNVQNLDGSNLNQVYEKIKRKVQHNIMVSYNIATESQLTPQLLLNLTKSYFPEKKKHSMADTNHMLGMIRYSNI